VVTAWEVNTNVGVGWYFGIFVSCCDDGRRYSIDIEVQKQAVPPTCSWMYVGVLKGKLLGSNLVYVEYSVW
jgi:hypothetical protein